MILLALFVIGTQVGSFLNVCIWRLPRGESIVAPPSHCPGCDTRLRALDLVPLLSQICLRARCRYCGTKISWRYAGIEALVGVLFVLVGAQPGNIDGGLWAGSWSGDTVRLLQELLVVSCLVVIFWIDYETLLIPISAALLLGLAGVGADLWRVIHPHLAAPGTGPWPFTTAFDPLALTDGAVFGTQWLPARMPESLLAMVVTAGLLWIVREVFSRLYNREAMGFGDIFLVAAIAANIGWNGLLATFFFLSLVVGSAVGVILQMPRVVRVYRWAKRKKKKRGERSLALPLARHTFRKSIMPFGPSLAVGALVTMLYGGRLTDSYMAVTQFPVTSTAVVSVQPVAVEPPPP